MNIFLKAKEAPSFDHWISNLPEEDLRYLSSLTDDVNDDKLEDQDTFEQLIALCLHFTGNTEMKEKDLDDVYQKLVINISLELNVREGKMTKEGVYSMLPTEETARFKITEKGIQSVKNMFGERNR